MSVSINGYDILTDSRGVRVVFYKVNHSSYGEVLKRYNDFSTLHSHLTITYPVIILPPLPPKHSFSRLISKPWGYTEDTVIIGRRTRLLNHYIIKLLSIDELNGSPIIENFLNGGDNSEIKPLATSRAKQGILLVSPNPNSIEKMNPFLPQLPIPPVSYLKSFKSPNNEIYKPIEYKIKVLWSVIGNLEMNVKGIKSDLDKWRKQLVDLGGFLNIMSMMEVNTHQRSIIEQTGNRIDLTFLNIEVLTTSINKNVLELILIVKYSISEIVKVLHYRKMKECQLNYLSLRINKMQMKLKLLVDRLVQSLILKTSSTIVESPSLSRALKNLNINSMDDGSIDITETNPETVNIIKGLHEELELRQIPCYNSLKEDVKFVNEIVERQANFNLQFLITLLINVTDNWQSCWSQFNAAQVKVWNFNLEEPDIT